MNDDELIERLRATLRAEADAVTPMHGTQRVTPRRRRHRSGLAGVPYRAVGAVATAAAVVVAVAVTFSLHGDRSDRTTTVSPATHTTTTVPARRVAAKRSAPPSTVPSTAPTTPATAAEPPTTVAPPAPVVAVPSAFDPASITFVSATHGWVLGTDRCGSGTCLSLAQTTTSGRSWSVVTGPASLVTLPATGGTGALQVRFADVADGWIYERGTDLLWSTHTGGASWAAEALPGSTGAEIDSLETAGGTVVVAVGEQDGTVDVDSSPTDSSVLSRSAQIHAPAGGAAPAATVVMQASGGPDPVGWVLSSNDRGVIGGERLAGGSWTAWTTTPCATRSSPALIAASDADHLVAVCAPSGFGGPTSASLETSSDGGATFVSVSGATPDQLTAVATPTAGTVVGISVQQPGRLDASIAGGAWQTVGPLLRTGSTILQVGFEDALQGVAVVRTPTGGAILMSADGGRTWSVSWSRTSSA